MTAGHDETAEKNPDPNLDVCEDFRCSCPTTFGIRSSHLVTTSPEIHQYDREGTNRGYEIDKLISKPFIRRQARKA